MARANDIKTNFTAGEVSAELKGRVDIPRYPNSAETMENVWVRIKGGADRSEGMRFISSTKLGGARKARLKRFQFSVDQAYLLEFGEFYVRFYTAAGQVILDQSGTAPLEVVSPYSEEQALALNFTQGGDTMFIFHPDVPIHRLRRLSANAWSLRPAPFVAEPFAEIGHRPSAKLTLSAASVGAGRTATASPTAPAQAPTIGTAFARNAAAAVNFTPPSDTGGLPIDYYEVTSAPGGIVATGAASPIIVNGLTNGVSYTFTVKAINGLGASPASAPSNAVTPSTSAGGTTILVNIDPAAFGETVRNGLITNIAGPVATSPDGFSPLQFFWQVISGNGSILITGGANTQQPTLQSTNNNSINYCTLRCSIIDATGGVGSRDVNCTIVHQREYEPPGGGGRPI